MIGSFPEINIKEWDTKRIEEKLRDISTLFNTTSVVRTDTMMAVFECTFEQLVRKVLAPWNKKRGRDDANEVYIEDFRVDLQDELGRRS